MTKAIKKTEIEATEAELESVAAVVAATEDQSAAPAKKKAAKKSADGKSWNDVLPGPDGKTVENMVYALGESLTERDTFEANKDSSNANIVRTLKKVRSQVVTKAAARVMVACNVDPGFINRVQHDGSRYNVYAIGKFADIVKALTGGSVNNAINIAVMKSLFQFRASDVVFNMTMAKAAASDKIKVDSSVNKILVRHTVSASTAPTQASSTMQALTTLGIVTAAGSKRNPTYTLTAHPVVKELEVLLAA